MKYKTLFAVICLFLPLFLGNLNIIVDAADIDLVQQHAPIFYFEKEETCYPVDHIYHIQNSYFYDNNGQLISNTPNESTISSYSSSELYDFYYLDNTVGAVNDDEIIKDYQSKESSLGYKVYYREYYHSSSGTTVIQYWMFYAFNKGHLNQHEGDWEMVQVAIPSSGSKWVAYSQHYIGQRATWDQVEKEDNNIKVYVARGSHANFLRSYSGKLGIANDYVGNNGKILRPGDYTLETLDGKIWLEYAGRWGELGGDIFESTGKSILGQAGPRGPKYRLDGQMWDGPVAWGQSLPEASDTMFLLEWFVYNFITIFIIITLLLFALNGFLIYRRHKKHGLGPRIVSILYIDGLNLKSIGNILCIVGIFIAIFGLLYPWYQVSYDTSALGISEEFRTFGMTQLMEIDGVNGIQIIIPGQNGFSPLGTISIPFSLVLGVSLIFLIVTTIGVAYSKKLGGKYIWRSIRLLIPILLILFVIMLLGSIISSEIIGSNEASDSIVNVLNSISSSPLGSEETFNIGVGNGLYAPLKMKWGLGLGGQLLLLAGAIIIIAGILELISRKTFFEEKIYEKPHKKKLLKLRKSKEPELTEPEKYQEDKK